MTMLSLVALSLASVAAAQKVGSNQAETHPSFTWTKGGQTVDAEVVIDANWRWTHIDGTNCFDGNDWTDTCSDNADCANCVVEGADYEATYGVTTSGDELRLSFVNDHEHGTNVGARMYLMNSETEYEMFDLIGNEFTFDVDLSTVACGINSALYFVAMEADGGVSQFPGNEAGAKYGTGYCDAQCARDLKFIGGEGNKEGWIPSSSDGSAGVGAKGACCAEIDVWESNAHSFALTPHACENNEFHICENDTCGGTYSEDRYNGLCDADGCDYNPYRLGQQDFYGAGKQLDTSSPFTVVTQFTATEIAQFFIQGGQRIDFPEPAWEGLPADNVVSQEFCDNLQEVFGERDRYGEVGGWTAMADALAQPHVLVMSIWADHYANMLWLDGLYPRGSDPEVPGHLRGDCPADSGVPSEVVANHPDTYVTWSNVRFGPIGSTTDL
jgi:cellulose 1,4-beta-cellobiosidase